MVSCPSSFRPTRRRGGGPPAQLAAVLTASDHQVRHRLPASNCVRRGVGGDEVERANPRLIRTVLSGRDGSLGEVKLWALSWRGAMSCRNARTRPLVRTPVRLYLPRILSRI